MKIHTSNTIISPLILVTAKRHTSPLKSPQKHNFPAHTVYPALHSNPKQHLQSTYILNFLIHSENAQIYQRDTHPPPTPGFPLASSFLPRLRVPHSLLRREHYVILHLTTAFHRPNYNSPNLTGITITISLYNYTLPI